MKIASLSAELATAHKALEDKSEELVLLYARFTPMKQEFEELHRAAERIIRNLTRQLIEHGLEPDQGEMT